MVHVHVHVCVCVSLYTALCTCVYPPLAVYMSDVVSPDI